MSLSNHAPGWRRRAWLACALAGGPLAGAPLAQAAAPQGASRRALAFPADFGAHPDTRIEWWYLTGTLLAAGETLGFQITFFRSRTDVAADQPSRFAARQLVFAHVALSDLRAGRLRHDQRIARAGFGIADTREGDTAVALRGWTLTRSGSAAASRYLAHADSDSAGFGFDLAFDTTQPLLLQGDAGFSQKGPAPASGSTAVPASHYYSHPHLAVSGTLRREGRSQAVTGTAWLDHEWSNALLDPQAVGWDWIGMNLADGSALTAFRLRRADGSALWAGGSFRSKGGTVQSFAADAVRFTPLRRWQSPASKASYPVEWTIDTPAGRYTVKTLLDNQELDSRSSTGSIYWEGLSELLGANGQRVGQGYLEMTGYAGALAL